MPKGYHKKGDVFTARADFGEDTRKKMSKDHERRTASDINGAVQSGSGSAWNEKGDVKSKHLLGECKVTESFQYPLHALVWRKIEKEANNANLRIPFMRVTTCRGDFAVITRDAYDMNGFATNNPTTVEKECRRMTNVDGDESKHFHVNYVSGERISIIPWKYFLETAKELGWIE